MIKPPKAVVITDGASRKKVYAYDYSKLEKYCDDLERHIKKTNNIVGPWIKYDFKS